MLVCVLAPHQLDKATEIPHRICANTQCMQVAFIYSIAGLLMLTIAMQKLIDKVRGRPVECRLALPETRRHSE